MTKLKVFSLLPALLLASIAQAWEAPEIRELSAAEIQPKHESLQPHKSLVVQLDSERRIQLDNEGFVSLFNLTNPSLSSWIRRSESVR